MCKGCERVTRQNVVINIRDGLFTCSFHPHLGENNGRCLIACRTLCGVILFLCLFGTTADVILSFAESTSYPSAIADKSNGYLPTSNDTMEIDGTRETADKNVLERSKMNGFLRTENKAETTPLIIRPSSGKKRE